MAPVVPTLGTVETAEGQTLTLPLAATDPDRDPLFFDASGLPPGSTFDRGQGLFTWTPAVYQAGTYSGLVFTASDGNRTSTATLTIKVANTNQAPVLNPTYPLAGRENAPLQFTLTASDLDSDHLTFAALTPLPSGARLDPTTGRFQWTPGFEQAGDYNLTFAAQDPGHRYVFNGTTRVAGIDASRVVSGHGDVSNRWTWWMLLDQVGEA